MHYAMNRIAQIILVILAGMLALFTGCSKQDKGEDKVINVAPDDAEMNAAIAKARTTLPEFWKVFEKPEHGENGFSLKVRITDKRGAEHFWVTDIQRQDGKIMGTINNDPEVVASVKMGQRIEVPDADISDWLYMRDDKMVGNETVRPLLKRMPADEANKIKSMLANP